MTTFIVNKNDENQTIFNFIKKNFRNTKLTIIYKWFRTGKIKINNKKNKDTKYLIQLNDEIKIFDSSQNVKRDFFKPIDFSSLQIIFEDENLLIVDKPSNLEIHSPINDSLDLMVKSYLIDKKEYDPMNENSFVVSHIHRLDKLTKGLVIYAKNKISLDCLLKEINNKNKIEKFYLAKLENNKLPIGLVSGFIKYDQDIKKAIFKTNFFSNSKKAEQINKCVDKEKNLFEINLLTGRKHQIRAICSFFDSPICKDFRYGAKKTIVEDIDLIAYKIKFNNFDNHLSYLNEKEYKSNYIF